MAKKKSNVLKTMFPGEVKIKLTGDDELKVRPLSLEDFPKVTDTLGDLLEKFQKFRDEQMRAEQSGDEIPSNVVLLKIGMKEIVKLIPFCVSEPNMRKIPVSVLPQILKAIVELNFTEDTIKNWVALFKTFTGMIPSGEVIRQSVKEITSPDQSQSESSS